MIVVVVLLAVHVVISIIAIKLYRNECLITGYKPSMMDILASLFPLLNLMIISKSMEEINKRLPDKPTLAEYILRIKQKDYWTS